MWTGLFPYQRDAISKMKNGCILCGDVGSGKSRTAIAYYYKTCGGCNLMHMNIEYQGILTIVNTEKKHKIISCCICV